MKAIYKVTVLRNGSPISKLVHVEVKSAGHAAIVGRQLDSNPNVQNTVLLSTEFEEVIYAFSDNVATIDL